MDDWVDCSFTCGVDCHGQSKYPCLQILVNVSASGHVAALHYNEEAVQINPKVSTLTSANAHGYVYFNSTGYTHQTGFWVSTIIQHILSLNFCIQSFQRVPKVLTKFSLEKGNKNPMYFPKWNLKLNPRYKNFHWNIFSKGEVQFYKNNKCTYFFRKKLHLFFFSCNKLEGIVPAISRSWVQCGPLQTCHPAFSPYSCSGFLFKSWRICQWTMNTWAPLQPIQTTSPFAIIRRYL